jgi:hypothetical protein
MNINETLEFLKSNKVFSEASIDINERRRLICVAWFDGPENPQAVEILTAQGFEKANDHYRCQFNKETVEYSSIENIKDNCQPPRGLRFEEWIING